MPTSPKPATQQRQYGQYEKDEENNFRYTSKGTGNASKTEQCSDQRDHK
jgi:hypothetical protein